MLTKSNDALFLGHYWNTDLCFRAHANLTENKVTIASLFISSIILVISAATL